MNSTDKLNIVKTSLVLKITMKNIFEWIRINPRDCLHYCCTWETYKLVSLTLSSALQLLIPDIVTQRPYYSFYTNLNLSKYKSKIINVNLCNISTFVFIRSQFIYNLSMKINTRKIINMIISISRGWANCQEKKEYETQFANLNNFQPIFEFGEKLENFGEFYNESISSNLAHTFQINSSDLELEI